MTGLVGNIAAGSLTGALTVTTGNAADNGISITTGSGATSITASGASDVVTVTATALAENTTLTLAGSAAETVTGLVGNIAAGSLTGALTVTTGDAADDGISDCDRLGRNLGHCEWRQRHGDGRRDHARQQHDADFDRIRGRGGQRSDRQHHRQFA